MEYQGQATAVSAGHEIRNLSVGLHILGTLTLLVSAPPHCWEEKCTPELSVPTGR